MWAIGVNQRRLDTIMLEIPRLPRRVNRHILQNRSFSLKNESFGSLIRASKWLVSDQSQKAFLNRAIGDDRGKELTIIHFNDVYDIFHSDSEPVGGAARFAQLVKEQKEKQNPLVLFSGDCLNPSILSAFTKGEHKVPILNALGVHVAALGNHDFDFGIEELELRMAGFEFPWLLSNVLDRRTGKHLAGALESIEMEWNGVKLGIIGLVEKEWLATIPSIDIHEDVIYKDFVEEGRRLSKALMDNGVDLVIALTHMRAPNDELLASQVSDIHLILGGHDHSPQADFVPPYGTLLLKSGTDFREFSVLKVAISNPDRTECKDIVVPSTNDTDSEIDCCSSSREDVVVSWKRIYVNGDTPEDPKVAKIVSYYHEIMGTRIMSPLGWTLVDLDARFDSVRCSETALGNLLADVMRLGLGIEVDGAMLNSGTIRSDRIHASGQLSVKDLITMLPFTDELVVLRLSGQDIIDALEISVSAWPAKEGRFLQISGISYAFDSCKNPGSRVLPDSVKIGNESIQLDRKYVVATKAYLRSGKDGFETLKNAEVVMCSETAPRLVTLIHALLSRIQFLNDCIENEEIVTQSDCSILRGTQLESLCHFCKSENRYGIGPVVEDRICEISNVIPALIE